MERHPSDEEILLRLRSGETDPHAGCPRCRERAAALRPMLDLLSAPSLLEAPEPLLRSGIEWIRAREHARKPRKAASPVRRAVEAIRGVLVLDTRAGLALAGVRGGPEGVRVLAYDCAAGTVHLQIRPGPDRIEMRGQFVPADGQLGPKASAVLDRDGKETVRKLSDSGEFVFGELTPGTLRIRVEWSDRRMDLDPLEIP